jgi:hypothetical protein
VNVRALCIQGTIQTEDSRQKTEDSSQQIEDSRQHHVPEQKIELVELERPACMGGHAVCMRQDRILRGWDEFFQYHERVSRSVS